MSLGEWLVFLWNSNTKTTDGDIMTAFNVPSAELNYCTVRRYCKLKGIKISNKIAQSFGRLSAKICRKKGYPIGKVEDDLYVEVNSYPIEVLDEVSQLYTT